MNILHINTNYEVSTIYPNMLYEFNQLKNITGRIYYPVFNSNKKINDKNKGFVDISNCLKKFDRYFFFNRNKKLFKDITKLYNIKDYKMVIAYSLFSNGFLAYTLKKNFNIPYIVIVQNTDVNMYFKRMVHLRRIGRRIIQEAYKVVFISNPYKQLLLNKYINNSDKYILEKKSVVIPFGIDNFWFENLYKVKSLKEKNHLKLLYVGKIDRNKNLITTLKVCDKLLKQGIKVSYTVVGKIIDPRIGNKIKNYKCATYIPFLEKDKLLKIYRENDIFIMPSIRESFGLVYAEAMSQGLPIIYTRGQGFDKHFQEGKIGHGVYPTDTNEIVNSIIDIKNNYELYSKNCLNLVKKFKWNNIMRDYEIIIKELTDSFS